MFIGAHGENQAWCGSPVGARPCLIHKGPEVRPAESGWIWQRAQPQSHNLAGLLAGPSLGLQDKQTTQAVVGLTLEDLCCVLPTYPSGSPDCFCSSLALANFNLFPWPGVGVLERPRVWGHLSVCLGVSLCLPC